MTGSNKTRNDSECCEVLAIMHFGCFSLRRRHGVWGMLLCAWYLYKLEICSAVKSVRLVFAMPLPLLFYSKKHYIAFVRIFPLFLLRFARFSHRIFSKLVRFLVECKHDCIHRYSRRNVYLDPLSRYTWNTHKKLQTIVEVKILIQSLSLYRKWRYSLAFQSNSNFSEEKKRTEIRNFYAMHIVSHGIRLHFMLMA